MWRVKCVGNESRGIATGAWTFDSVEQAVNHGKHAFEYGYTKSILYRKIGNGWQVIREIRKDEFSGKKLEFTLSFEDWGDKNIAKMVLFEYGAEITNAYQCGKYYCLTYMATIEQDIAIVNEIRINGVDI